MSNHDLSAAGDDDRWMLLERWPEGGVRLVVRSRINATIGQFAAAQKVCAVICDVRPDLVREDGFPLCLDELHDLEDRIVAEIAAAGGTSYHTASVTGDARRVIYIAFSEANPAEAIAGMASEVAEVSVFEDFDFETYRDFVTPTPLDVQLDGDGGVIRSLQDNGDDGQVPRRVDFWFYGERGALDTLLAELASEGYAFSHWLEEHPGVVLHRELPADLQTFHEVTPQLLEAAERYGVTYDGWETFVVRPQPEQTPVPPKPTSFLSRLFGAKKN